VFPTIGKGGLGIGGAHGSGRVYEHGRYVGDTSMTQVSLGLRFGGEAFSQIVFPEDRRAFEEFTRGGFEFGAEVSAVVITAGALAGAGTSGPNAGASGGKKDATTAGKYYKGMAVFTTVARHRARGDPAAKLTRSRRRRRRRRSGPATRSRA
jgi:hypothetical protein